MNTECNDVINDGEIIGDIQFDIDEMQKNISEEENALIEDIDLEDSNILA